MARTRLFVDVVNSVVAKVVNTQATSCAGETNLDQQLNVDGENNNVSGNKMIQTMENVSKCVGQMNNNSDLQTTVFNDIKAQLTEKQKGLFAGLTIGSTKAETVLKNSIDSQVTNENILNCYNKFSASQIANIKGRNNKVEGNEMKQVLSNTSECIASAINKNASMVELGSKLDAVLEKETDMSLFGFDIMEIGAAIAALIVFIIIIKMVSGSGSRGYPPPYMMQPPMAMPYMMPMQQPMMPTQQPMAYR